MNACGSKKLVTTYHIPIRVSIYKLNILASMSSTNVNEFSCCTYQPKYPAPVDTWGNIPQSFLTHGSKT